MAISGTTPITAPVAPSSASDAYPSHIAEYGKGGYMAVADNAARDAIVAARRTYGMQVYVIATGITYIMGPGLSNGEWSVSNRGAQIVDDVAALAALTGSSIANGTEFHVRSYNSIGDGGEGDFYYDSGSSASAVAGVIVVPAGSVGRFIRKIKNSELDIRCGGAIGDGATDCAAIINNLLVWGSANDVAIVIPGGDYRTTDPILLRNNSRLIGKGGWIVCDISGGSTSDLNDSVIRNHDLFTGLSGTPRTSVSNLCENIHMSGIKIRHASSGVTARGVTLIGCHNVYLEDIEIERTYGIWAFTFFCKDLQATGLKVNDNQSIFEDGIHILGGEGYTFTNCNIQSGDDSFAIGWDASDVYCRDVVFADSVVRSVRAFGLKIFNPNGSTTSQEKIVFSNITGEAGSTRNGAVFFFEQTVQDGRIKDVTVNNCNFRCSSGTHDTVNPYGIWLLGCANITFNNCLCEGADSYQVFVDTAKGPITFNGGRFKTPVNATTETVFINSCGAFVVTLDGCIVENTQYRAIKSIESDFIVRNCKVLCDGAMHISLQQATSNTRFAIIESSLLTGTSVMPFDSVGGSDNLKTFVFALNSTPAGSANGTVTANSYLFFGNSGMDTTANSIKDLSAEDIAAKTLTISDSIATTAVTSTNGSSGWIANITGGSSALFRLQEAGTTKYLFSGGASRSLTMGSGVEASPPDCVIYSAPAAGTDLPGGDLLLAAGWGTGNASTKGRIKFNTPDAGSTGSAAQSMKTALVVEREGHLWFSKSFAADPTVQVNDGDIFYRGDRQRLRTRLNGKFGDLERNTIRALTGTTVNVLLTDEIITTDNAGAVTVNLPAGVLDHRLKFKNVGAGTATLTPNGAETIFTTTSVATLAMVTGDSVTLHFDGTRWLSM